MNYFRSPRALIAIIAVVLLSVNGLPAAEPATSEEAGGDQAAELAKQLQNPVANLISVPFQNILSSISARTATALSTHSTFSRSFRFHWARITISSFGRSCRSSRRTM